MVLPIVVGLGFATVYTLTRAGFRAYKRFKALPPDMFMDIPSNSFRQSKINFHKGGFEPKMTVPEAMMILEIKHFDTLTADNLRKQHRHVMINNHPDKGGSSYIAMKVNEARDVLEKAKHFK